MKYSTACRFYGLALIASGFCALVWHNYDALPPVAHRGTLIYIMALAEILAGIAIQLPQAVRAGAIAAAAVYLTIVLLGLPQIIKHPLVYNVYGNFFEQFSYVAAAMIVFACASRTVRTSKSTWALIGYYSFALCVLSFGLEQLFYLAPTATLVPKWIPPSQMFWAIATTIAFGLAAIALLTGFQALLAARLNTAMLLGFGILVWLPLLFANPHSFTNWSETAETFAIAATAWLVTDFIVQRRATPSA